MFTQQEILEEIAELQAPSTNEATDRVLSLQGLRRAEHAEKVRVRKQRDPEKHRRWKQTSKMRARGKAPGVGCAVCRAEFVNERGLTFHRRRTPCGSSSF